MVIRGTPKFGYRSNRALLLLTAFFAPFPGCSNQDPAFVEKTSGRALTANTRASESGTGSSLDATGNPNSDEPIIAEASAGGVDDVVAAADQPSDTATSGDAAAAGDVLASGEVAGSSDPRNSGDKSSKGEDDDKSSKGQRGHGTESDNDLEPVTMTYKQAANSLVDILWIVDTSGSMKEEQDYLSANFKSFISALSKSGLNFQTAVTTTDICPSKQPSNLEDVVCPGEAIGSAKTHLRGSFIGGAGRKVLKRNEPDLIDKFSEYTTLGVNGSGFEHGLKAADLAIEKVISGDNENLIRNEAFLAVIVVSDEEDDGIGLGMKDGYSHKNYVEKGLTKFRFSDKDFSSHLKALKGDGKFSVSAITGTRDKDGKMCTSPHSQPEEEGTQYINAAKATGGAIQSICDTNWDDSLFKLGRDIESQISQVALERTPATGSLKVFVDNVLTDKWSYSEGTKIVKFLPDSIPHDGATIRVEFLAMPGA